MNLHSKLSSSRPIHALWPQTHPWLPRCIVLSMVCFFVMLLTAGNLHATDVSGAISTDTTWMLVDSPYHATGDLTIDGGITLTIEAGVTVKFASGTYLYVYGALAAIGTSGSEIVLTDRRDDTIGGDTNGDGDASAPGAGG